jgi:hypothetical protein
MKGQQLLGARNVAKQEWVRRNPELAACLVGKDYTSQFEQTQKRDGYKKAKDFIQRKARASSIPANRFKFLWVSECSPTVLIPTVLAVLTARTVPTV